MSALPIPGKPRRPRFCPKCRGMRDWRITTTVLHEGRGWLRTIRACLSCGTATEPKPPKPIARAAKPVTRKARPRKQRKTPLATLKRKLWAAFAAYVKERDGNTCFVCGASGLVGSNWHAGHMFNAGNNSVIRFHPLNVHSNCGRCNVWLRGNIAVYVARFLDVYGIEQFKALDARRGAPKAWTRPEVEAMIAALKAGGAAYELHYEQTYGAARRTT